MLAPCITQEDQHMKNGFLAVAAAVMTVSLVSGNAHADERNREMAKRDHQKVETQHRNNDKNFSGDNRRDSSHRSDNRYRDDRRGDHYGRGDHRGDNRHNGGRHNGDSYRYDGRHGGIHYAPPRPAIGYRYNGYTWGHYDRHHSRRHWNGRWYYGPAPHHFWHNGHWYWGPGFIGGVVLGTIIGNSFDDNQPRYNEYSPPPQNRVTGCYRIERLPNGTERRVNLPIGECLD